MKCAFCGKELIVTKTDGFTLSDKTNGAAVHNSCYKKKFGTDSLDDMTRPLPKT